jgi:hypothetical protein
MLQDRSPLKGVDLYVGGFQCGSSDWHHLAPIDQCTLYEANSILCGGREPVVEELVRQLREAKLTE